MSNLNYMNIFKENALSRKKYIAMMSNILLFVILLSACDALRYDCPTPEKIEPHCICKNLGDGPMMLCSNFMSPEEMVSPIKETEDYDMFSLAIHDSTLQYIPDNIFLKTNYKKMRLVGTELMSLSETDIAFEGLEDTMEEFRVMGANYVTEWRWDELRNLKKLSLIEVDEVSLGTISEPFPKLESLVVLGILRGDISFVVDSAFEELVNLKILNLQNNEISELSRSMLPNPAQNLMIINLSDNKLDTLPADFFDEMPSLSDVSLDNNNFITLNEASFASVLRQQVALTLRGNNIRCDCRMQWIVDVSVPMEFEAECSGPGKLKGVQVKHLVLKDLRC